MVIKTLPSISRRLLRCGWDLSGTDPHRSYRTFKSSATFFILSIQTGWASKWFDFYLTSVLLIQQYISCDMIYLIETLNLRSMVLFWTTARVKLISSNTILVDTWGQAVVRFRLFGINFALPNLQDAFPKDILISGAQNNHRSFFPRVTYEHDNAFLWIFVRFGRFWPDHGHIC